MSSKFNLLAGSGLVSLALLSIGTSAEARVHHATTTNHGCRLVHDVREHHRMYRICDVTGGTHRGHKVAHRAAAKGNSENEALKEQIASLTARLDAAELAQRQTADQAAAAQAAAAEANARPAPKGVDMAAVNTQIKSAVNAAVPKTNNDTKITGTFFLNASNINQQNVNAAGVATKSTPSGTGFDVKRAYIGVEHNFSPMFAGAVVLDAQAGGAYKSNTNLGGTNVYIKKAYLQAKLNDALTVRLGAADLPWVPFVEGIYENRFVENIVEDRTKFATSSDWGVHALGTLGNPKGFNIGYAVSAINGGGYKNPTRSNSVDLEGRISANFKGFTAAAGGYTGKLAQDAQNTTAATTTAKRVNALLAYSHSRFRIGAEYFWAKNYLSETATVVPATAGTQLTGAGTPGNLIAAVVSATNLGPVYDSAEGESIFAKFYATKKFNVFARYDHVTPSNIQYLPEHDVYYNMGVDYTPVKGIDVALVYKHEKVSAAASTLKFGVSTSNGTIGAAGNANGTYDEFGIFSQVKF